ncbi:MAG: RDD family protein [Gammaproteobacteria bacterium]
MSEPIVHPDNYRYAGFLARMLAMLVDVFIIMVLLVLAVISMVFTGILTLGLIVPTLPAVIMEISLLILVIVLWTQFGATPGKMMLNIVIVDRDTGKLPSLGQAVIRYIGYIVSTIPFLLGYFWVIWDDKKQGFHDKLADTVVVYKN